MESLMLGGWSHGGERNLRFAAPAGVILSPHITRAVGPFEVKLVPLTASDAIPGRMSIDKQFHGDLEATSKGEMLMAAAAVKGSAGYVAIEQVAGTLHGRRGTFLLQHNGTMNRGE